MLPSTPLSPYYGWVTPGVLVMASGIQDTESVCKRPHALLGKADEWILQGPGEAPLQPLGIKRPKATPSSLGQGSFVARPGTRFFWSCPQCLTSWHLAICFQSSHTLAFPPVCSLHLHTWHAHSCVHTATQVYGSLFRRS